MRFPIQLQLSLLLHLMKNGLRRTPRYPLVLMLEPLHLCNLTCVGCGRIREYESTIHDRMSVEECLQAVEECPAPVVSICGGEPLIHPQIDEVVRGILDKRRHIYLCTNATLLERQLHKFRPSPYFNINIHLDGLAATHDAIVERPGVFQQAIRALKAAKAAGFRVCTNTTIYKETDIDEVEILFAYLDSLGVDGMLVSPGYSYEAVKGDHFLDRREVNRKFARIYEMSKRYRITNSPLYMKFLKGERELDSTPWGNPTRNPQGWKSPCYLITDGHYPTFKELMEKTDWSKYGPGKDRRCDNCMVHSGFEATAVREVGRRWTDLVEMIRWNLS